MPPLLSIAEAQAVVADAVRPLRVDEIPISDALGRFLAEDVTAAHDVPPFANSAMDGFAVTEGPAGRTLEISGESRAGAPSDVAVTATTAVRISTGAQMPEGADGVIPVERVSENGRHVTLEDAVVAGRNVRGPGEDLAKGELVLHAGSRFGPAELGVAIGAGRGAVRVGRRPHVAVVSTGDELVAPGNPLRAGQIHNSNATTLAALAALCGADVRTVSTSADTREATLDALGQALDGSDVVIISGGVSVGPHDHVKPALDELGVEQRFWRVALRPGKPTWFGTRDGALVFGLPGNPVSAMVTFLLFARPALHALQHGRFEQPRAKAVLAADVERLPDRDELVRVGLQDGLATPTGDQRSHLVSSMLGADALAVIEAGDAPLPKGSVVTVLPLHFQ